GATREISALPRAAADQKVIPVVANQLKREISMATTATATEKTEKKQQQMQQPKSEHKPQRRHDEKFKIFCGTANEALTEEICAFLTIERGKATVTRFSDGECYVQLL